MGLEVEDHAWDAALGELLFQLRDHFGEVAQNSLVTAVAQICGHEAFQLVLIDVAHVAAEMRVVVILDVYPADAGLHGQVLLEALLSGVSLADDVAAVEDRDERWMVY